MMDSVRGVLILRAADGYSRNALLANQVDFFKRYGSMGNNRAQQAANWLSAAGSMMPFVMGCLSSRLGSCRVTFVLLGCSLEIMGIALVAGAASFGDKGLCRWLILLGLFGPFTLGFGAVTSSLPVVGSGLVAEEVKGLFMQAYFAALAAGGMAGILAAAMWQAWNLDAVGLVLAACVLLLGTLALACQHGSSCMGKEALCGAKSVPSQELDGEAAAAPQQNHKAQLPLARLWLLPMFLPFSGAYLQWTSSWYIQTQYMNCNLWGWKVPESMLQFVERVVALLALLALRELFRRFGQEQDSEPFQEIAARRLRWRMFAGTVVAGVAMAVSAVVEVARREWTSPEAGEHQVSSLSVVLQLPQFILIAIAEAFMYPAQTEWASDSPILVGLVCSVQAIAAALLGFIVGYLEVWIPNGSPTSGRYDLFFLALSILCFASAGGLFLLPPNVWRPGCSPYSDEEDAQKGPNLFTFEDSSSLATSEDTDIALSERNSSEEAVKEDCGTSP